MDAIYSLDSMETIKVGNLIVFFVVFLFTLVPQIILKNIYMNNASTMLKEYMGNNATKVLEIIG